MTATELARQEFSVNELPPATSKAVPPATSFRLIGWSLAAALLFLSLAAPYAYYVVFSRSMSVDEGYLMITLQSFNEGNPLYDSVFTQYGHFYYAYEWVLRTQAAIPLTHDATRLLCIFHWLTAAALLGIAGGSLLRSPLTGLFIFAQAVVHLTPLANEPGHPQEVVAVLLGLGALVSTRCKTQLRVLQWSAAITAALLFTKINVGIFFGIAIFLLLRCSCTDRFTRGMWVWITAAACAFLPFALTRRHLSADWCRNFTLVAACAVFTTLLLFLRSVAAERSTLIANRKTPENSPSPLGATQIAVIATCFFLLSALMLAVAFFTGTSLRGLIDGLLLVPLKMPGVQVLPLVVPNIALLNATAALALGVPAAIGRLSPQWHRLLQALKLIYGIAGSLLLLGNPQAQFIFLLPWLWVVLVPANCDTPQLHTGRKGFSRLFLCLAAVWQSLQIYPNAGTQVTLATLLLVPTYALSLHDFFVGNLLSAIRARFWQRSPFGTVDFIGRKGVWLHTFAVVCLLAVFTNVWCKLPAKRLEYASLPSLRLPGSELVHMDLEVTQMYRELAKYLQSECDTFVTYPGINSLYFWTGKRPPTHLNSTGWGQLSHQQQNEILTALRKSRRPMLAVVAAEVDWWIKHTPPQIAPLIRFVFEDCREVNRIGRFIIFIPKSA